MLRSSFVRGLGERHGECDGPAVLHARTSSTHGAASLRESEPPLHLPLARARARPREALLSSGLEGSSDHELLALVLGRGDRDRSALCVARALLDDAGGLEALARTSPRRLARATGLGAARAARVIAALELGRRATERATLPKGVLSGSHDVARHFSVRLGSLVHEEMWVLSLDGRNRLRAQRRAARGGLHGCSVAARDLLRIALEDGASGFVVVHNHPSGDPSPSLEDVSMTHVVAAAAAVVGVPLLDHVIVTASRHSSLAELGLLEPPDERR